MNNAVTSPIAATFVFIEFSSENVDDFRASILDSSQRKGATLYEALVDGGLLHSFINNDLARSGCKRSGCRSRISCCRRQSGHCAQSSRREALARVSKPLQ